MKGVNMYNGYKALRDQIVISGVESFESGVKKYRKYIADAEKHKRGVANALRDVKEASDFFKSTWYETLMGGNGYDTLNRLVEKMELTDEEIEAFGI